MEATLRVHMAKMERKMERKEGGRGLCADPPPPPPCAALRSLRQDVSQRWIVLVFVDVMDADVSA